MKTRWLLVVIIGLSSKIASFGQCPTTYNYQTSANNNTWAGESWAAAGGSVTTGGAPPAAWGPKSFLWSYNSQTYTNCIVIPAGVVVNILDNSLYMGAGITLVVQGTLVANGKIDVDQNTGIIIDTGGLICCNGSCNASDRITLGGNSNSIWGGPTNNFSPVTGPTSCSGGCTELPITLINFAAKANSSSIALSWSTAAELNFDHFKLEKSSDGIIFNSLASIKGHGTTNERHDYSFEDHLPVIGRNYYRLTSVDFDNYQETFKVIVQNYSGEKNFQVSPNPTDGRSINLNFNFDSKQGQIVIYDNMGFIVDSFQVSETGEVTFANPLKNGIYFAKYSSPSFSKAIRFLVKQ